MKARQLICGLMASIQVLYPITAAASNYYYFKKIQPIAVNTGTPVGSVNIDSSNTTVATAKAGNGILRAAPSQVNFGTVPAGEQATPQTVTLSNVGTAPLTLGTLSTTSQFGVSNNCDNVVLGALSTCQVNITFNPTQQNNTLVSGKIQIPFSSDNSSADVLLDVSGTAAAPLASNNKELSMGGDSTVSAGVASINFDPAIINMQEFSKNITITASATKPVTLNSVVLQGDTTSFAVDRSACPDTIAIGSSCNIVAKFHPTTLGDKSATVVINSDAYNGNSLPVSLTGKAIEVYGVVDGNATTTSVDFGTIIQGATAVVKTATIKNKGTGDLKITGVSLTSAPAGITISNNGCTTIAPNATCSISLTAATSSLFATNNTALVITHDGRLTPTSPLSIPITGNVIAQTRQLSYDVSEVAFGNVDSAATVQKTLTITNTGNSTVNPITATVASPFTAPATTCNVALAPNANCTITFQLSSSTMGAVSKAITISSSGLTTAAPAINATGYIVNRTMTTSVSTLGFGLQTSDMWSDEKIITVTNAGNAVERPDVVGRQADGTIAGLTWAKVKTNTCSGADVPVGGTCQIGIQINPTSTASLNGSISIVPMTGLTTSPYVKAITLTGQGTTQNYSVSVSSLDYGVVDSMAVVDKVVTVTNTSTNSGTAVTGFSGVSFSQPTGATGTLSVVNNTCTTSLAFGATCSFTVRMTANPYIVDGSLPFTGSFSMYYSGARSATTAYPISGSLKGSPISVTMDKQNMGDITYGATVANSPVVRFTVTNTGTGSVKPYSTEFLGQFSAVGLPATQVASTCTNKTVTAGQSCYTDFRFQSTVWAPVGSQTTRMSVVSSNLNSSTTSYVDVTGNILAPELTLGDTTIDMGTVGENSYVDKTISVALTKGDSAVFDHAISGTGYSLPQVVSTSCTNASTTSGGYYVLNKNSVCNITIRVTVGVYSTPTLTGTYNAYIRTGTAANTTARTQTYGPVALTAAAEAGGYSVDYNGIQWDNVPLQEAGYGRYAIVRNTSTTTVLTLSGTANPPPTVVDTTSSTLVHSDNVTYNNCYKLTSSKLNPGASCFIRLTLSGVSGANSGSGSSGPFSSTFTLNTNAKFGAITLPLTGTFLPGQLSTDADSLNFAGDTPVNTVNPNDQVLTITNTGTGNMVFKSDGSNRQFVMPTYFYIVNSAGSEVSSVTTQGATLVSGSANRCETVGALRPGASCKLTIRFHPASTDTRNVSTSFTISSYNPEVATKTISLTGSIIAGSLTTTATSFDFGAMATMSSYTKTITVTNTGQYAVNVYKIDRAYNTPWTSPAYPNDWSMTHNCPSVMQPGDSCVITVSITPDRNIDWSTTKERVIIYHDNAGVTKYTHLPLTGVSSGAEITVNEPDMGIIEKGPVDNITEADTRVMTLTSTGTTPVRIVSLPVVNGALFKTVAGGTCSVGQIMNPGESCTIKVGYYADYSSAAIATTTSGNTYFTVNGQIKAGAAAAVQYSAVERLPYSVISAPSISSINPNTVATSTSTPVKLVNTAIANTVFKLDGNPLTVDLTNDYTTIPSGLSVGTHTITMRQPVYGIERSITFNVTDSGVSSDASNAVYTVFKGGYNTIQDSAVLSNGYTVQSNGLEVYLYNAAGVLVNYAYNGSPLSTTNWVSRVIPTTNGFILAAGGEYVSNPCQYGSCITDGIAALARTYTVSGDTLVIGNSNSSILYTYYTNQSYTNQAPSKVSATATANGVAIGIQLGGYTPYMVAYNASTNTFGSAVAVPAGGPLAMAADTTNLYVRVGSSIYSYPLSGTTLSAGTQYTYSGTLGSDTTKGMGIYNGTLYVSCGGGVSICSAPVSSGALGAMGLAVGATRGYQDGNVADAKLDIYNLKASSQGIQIMQNSPGLPVRVYH